MDTFNGQLIKGYELRDRIGAGGFGTVYKAFQSTVGREVAIKVILPHFASQPDFIRRFEAEAQIVARLEHLHIVPLYDYWRDPEGAYLVMRWMRGGSLGEELKRGPYELAAASLLLDQIAAALHRAHTSSVIHRDIKPGNILLDEDHNAYLGDFGIAKELAEIRNGATRPDALMGSPDYLAPEQARSEPVTPQTDIYSLGVVLYEMLAGDHPFPGLTPVERLFKHLNDPLPLLQNLEPELLDAINAFIQKATSKNPAHRYADALEMAAAFRGAAAIGTTPVSADIVTRLTWREQEILQLLIEGKSNNEIAQQLVITSTTVRWYLRHLYRKLGVRSRMQAIVRARELDLVVGSGAGEAVSGADSRISILLPEPENPYKGLRAFQPADSPDFFGRETLTEKLLARMQEKSDSSRFLAVVGPSGSGKSSLVGAGLIPALWRGELPGSEKWFVVDLLPGVRPLDELEIALTRVAADQAANLGEHLRRDAAGLLRVAGLILPKDGSELLIVVDQFEEVFTLVEDEGQRKQFLNLLSAAVSEPRSRVRVIVTLRADFYDRPLQYPGIAELVQARTETVLPLSSEELERAITKPAKRAGLKFEEGLVASIVGEVHYQPGALPLLQYALTELFEVRENRTLTHAGYQKIGRAVGALATRAEEIYSELDRAGQEAVRQMFLRLVTLGEGVEDTRRRVPRSELMAIAAAPDVMEEAIDTFARYRLLSLDHDPATRHPTVEVAHEALLREWDRLRGWLNESRADIRLQRQLAYAAGEWEAAKRDPSFLLRGARLDQFEGWSKATELALTQAERGYLQACLSMRDSEEATEAKRQAREMRLERRARTVLRVLVGVFAVAAVVSGGLAIFASQQRQDARMQAAILLAAQAESEAEDGYYDRAVLLGLEALENYPYTAQAEHALGQAVSYNRALQQYTAHTSAVTSVDWSPDGTKIASSSTDNTVQIWDAATGETLLVIDLPEGITGNIYDWALTAKWSPDGSRLLTVSGDRFLLGSQDYDLILWDVATGQQAMTIELPNKADPAAGEGVVTSAEHFSTGAAAAFAPRSGRLATVGGNNTALIWDAALTRRELTLVGHNDAVNGVDWSPDETRLATSSEDGTSRIWDARSGEELLALSGHDGAVNQVVWSPDGSQLATAGDDGTVRLWDATTGEMALLIEPDSGIVWSLAWSADGSQLVIGADDARIRLWDIESEKVASEFNWHKKFITYLAWSPADSRLASAGNDGVVRVWNAGPSTAALSLPYGYVGELDWSSEGRYLAVNAGDWWAGVEPNNVAVWDISSGQPVAEHLEPKPRGFGFHPHYSPDDRFLMIQGYIGNGPMGSLAEADYEAWLPVLDVGTWKLVRSFTIDEAGSFFRSAGWSPDGKLVAAGTNKGKLVVWDFQTGEPLIETSCGNWINTVDWAPNGTKIAILCQRISSGSGFINWIQVQDAATGEVLLTLSDPDPTAVGDSVAWSPDGTRLLTTGGSDEIGTQENPVIIWDANTGRKLLSIIRHTGQVWWGSWSPDGRRIATGSTDDTTRIWDSTTGAELLTLSTPNNWSAAPEWSPDGHFLAVGVYSFDQPTRSGVWRVWQTTEELIAYAKECCIFRELTPEEREQFGLPAESGQSTVTTPVGYGGEALPAVSVAFGLAGLGLVVVRRR